MTKKRVDNIKNSFQKPNSISDFYCHLLSGDEYKILDILIREIYGYEKKRKSMTGFISKSRLCGTMYNSDGAIYSYGSGLTRATAIKCFNTLKKFRFFKTSGFTQDGTRVTLTLNKIDLAGLERRDFEKRETNKKRTATATARRTEKSPGSTSDVPPFRVVRRTYQGSIVGRTKVVSSDVPNKPNINPIKPNVTEKTEKQNGFDKTLFTRLAKSKDVLDELDMMATGDDGSAAIAKELYYVLKRFNEVGLRNEVNLSWSFHLGVVTKFMDADKIFILKRTLAEVLAEKENLSNPAAVFVDRIKKEALSNGIELQCFKKKPMERAIESEKIRMAV